MSEISSEELFEQLFPTRVPEDVIAKKKEKNETEGADVPVGLVAKLFGELAKKESMTGDQNSEAVTTALAGLEQLSKVATETEAIRLALASMIIEERELGDLEEDERAYVRDVIATVYSDADFHSSRSIGNETQF